MNNRSKKGLSEIEKLTDQILFHKRKYYEGEPVISDAAYDILEDQLRVLDPNHPVLHIIGTPSDGKVTHDTPMLSCQKATDISDVLKWSKGYALFIGYKIDGFSLSLTYERGKLIQAATRGNGINGDDATLAVMKITSIPKIISENSRINIRGELFIRISEFNRINKIEKTSYSSPRNLAVGTVKQKDLKMLEQRDLEFFAFELLGYRDEADLTTKAEILKSWNFKTADLTIIRTPSEKKIKELFDQVEKSRNDLDFEIDGIVLKYNEGQKRKEAGSTEHHPKWMIALKFESKGKISTLKGITWQIGRLGNITPVAELEPIEVMGAVIKRATLHNAEFLETLDISVGDKVLVIRSGDVIPKITEIIEKGDSHSTFPQKCPSCDSSLIRDGVNLKCTGTNCREREIQKIHHWVKNVDIIGLGIKNITKMYDSDLVKHFADLYDKNITETKLVELFGKNGSKIFNNIQDSREIPFSIILAGLGIENLGKRMGKTLAKHFKSYEDLKKTSLAQLVKIEGISDTIANSIIQGLNDPSLGDYLLKNNVKIIYGKSKKKSKLKMASTLMDFISNEERKDILKQTAENDIKSKGLKIYVTGKVNQYSKKQIEDLLEKRGYEWAP
ncbi:MAG: NAD-dependent DNA ligase LigA, partial [Candidatus Hodarchaeales archaeon]